LTHPTNYKLSFTPLFPAQNLFEILNPYAETTSGENEKSEKIFLEFGHLFLYLGVRCDRERYPKSLKLEIQVSSKGLTADDGQPPPASSFRLPELNTGH
jgi:hypothetical protein